MRVFLFSISIYAKQVLVVTYLGLLLGGSPFFLQQNLLWVSSWTVVSSVQTTSSKLLPMLSLAQHSRFSLLACLMSWQYALPLNVQPRVVLHRRIVLRDRVNPFPCSMWKSWCAVVSSSSLICSSTTLITSGVILEGLPLPGNLRNHNKIIMFISVKFIAVSACTINSCYQCYLY